MVTSAVFDAEAAASRVVAALLPLADAQRAGQAKRYLKSDLDFLGVGVPAIRSAVTNLARSRRELDRDDALAWARALWREPVHERRTAAIEVLRWYTRRLLPADLALVEAWVREAPPGSDVRRDVHRGRPPAARGAGRAPSAPSSRTRFSVVSVKIQLIQGDISPFA